MHISQKTNTSLITENESDESSNKDEGEDDVGGENASQGNNGSDEERIDSNGEKSDQEDTTPQDKAGSKTHSENMGSSKSDGSSSKSEVQIKEIREVSPQKKKSLEDDSHTMLPELDSKATEEEW